MECPIDGKMHHIVRSELLMYIIVMVVQYLVYLCNIMVCTTDGKCKCQSGVVDVQHYHNRAVLLSTPVILWYVP